MGEGADITGLSVQRKRSATKTSSPWRTERGGGRRRWRREIGMETAHVYIALIVPLSALRAVINTPPRAIRLIAP